MTILPGEVYQLKNALLKAATCHVPAVGFSTTALLNALNEVEHKEQVSTGVLSSMFERGFEASLVEYIVKDTNMSTQKYLESKFSKAAVLNLIKENETSFLQKRFYIPKSKEVITAAVTKKIELLRPYKERWHEAVEIEYRLANVPYTVINLAEFVDGTSYFAERLENLNKLIEPAREILQSKAMASYIPTGNSDVQDKSPSMQFLETFVEGVPLASGPHDGTGLSLGWYNRRAKLGVDVRNVYGFVYRR